MKMQLVEAGSGYASSVSGYVLTVLTGATVLLLAWVVRTQLRIVLMQQKLTDAIFPTDQPSLPTQVQTIKSDVKDMRKHGSNRLNEILRSAHIIEDTVTNTDPHPHN